VYDEFRVVKVDVRFTAVTPPEPAPPYLIAFDNNTVTTTPTVSTVSSYATAKLMSGFYDGELSYQVPLPADGIWYNTDAPSTFTPTLAVVSTLPSSLVLRAYVVLFYEFEILVRGIV